MMDYSHILLNIFSLTSFAAAAAPNLPLKSTLLSFTLTFALTNLVALANAAVPDSFNVSVLALAEADTASLAGVAEAITKTVVVTWV